MTRREAAGSVRASPAPTESRLIDDIQRGAFGYFLHEVNRTNGLVRDKTCAGWPASIAAVGLGLTAFPVGMERGLVSRTEAPPCSSSGAASRVPSPTRRVTRASTTTSST